MRISPKLEAAKTKAKIGCYCSCVDSYVVIIHISASEDRVQTFQGN